MTQHDGNEVELVTMDQGVDLVGLLEEARQAVEVEEVPLLVLMNHLETSPGLSSRRNQVVTVTAAVEECRTGDFPVGEEEALEDTRDVVWSHQAGHLFPGSMDVGAVVSSSQVTTGHHQSSVTSKPIRRPERPQGRGNGVGQERLES